MVLRSFLLRKKKYVKTVRKRLRDRDLGLGGAFTRGRKPRTVDLCTREGPKAPPRLETRGMGGGRRPHSTNKTHVIYTKIPTVVGKIRSFLSALYVVKTT